MAYTTVEWFVIVFSVIAIIKLLTISVNAKGWLKLVSPLYRNGGVLFFIELILAAILFYYLLMELTIVQIMASVLFGALLTGMVFALYGKETLAWGKSLMTKNTLLHRAWLPTLIWLALSVWALVEIF